MPQHATYEKITDDDARWLLVANYWWHSTWILLISIWLISTPADHFQGAPWQYLMLFPHGDNWLGVVYFGIFFWMAFSQVTNRMRLFGRLLLTSGVLTGIVAALIIAGSIYGNHSSVEGPCFVYVFVQSLILSAPLTKQIVSVRGSK